MTGRDLVAAFIASPESRNRGVAAGIRSSFEQVDVAGLRMWVSSEDWAVGRIVLGARSYEAPVTDPLCGPLEPGGVFVDVGPNIGWFSLRAAKAVGPQGKAFAFEPNAHNCAFLPASAQDNALRNVTPRPMALGSEPGLVM